MNALTSVICPVCLGSDWESLFLARDPHYSIQGSWEIDKCRECGLWRLGKGTVVPLGTSEYPDNYYAYTDAGEHSEGLHSRRLRRLGRLLGIGTREPSLPPGKMIDLGSGDGKVVEEYTNKGWIAVGIEPDGRAVQSARKKNRNVILGTLNTANGLDFSSFDLIRSNHAFEHVQNPRECLERMLALLKPGGTGFIGVPNTRSFNARIFRSKWFYLGAPVHFYNYSPSSIKRLLESVGFVNVKVCYNGRPAALLGNLQIQLSMILSGRESSEGKLSGFPPFLGLALLLCKLFDLARVGDSIEVSFNKPR
jgi:SAM-dependent methyltransferase